MQPAVSGVLDRNWDGAMEGGVRVYGFAAYRAGFSLMLVWLVIAIALLLLTRETRCRQTPRRPRSRPRRQRPRS